MGIEKTCAGGKSIAHPTPNFAHRKNLKTPALLDNETSTEKTYSATEKDETDESTRNVVEDILERTENDVERKDPPKSVPVLGDRGKTTNATKITCSYKIECEESGKWSY